MRGWQFQKRKRFVNNSLNSIKRIFLLLFFISAPLFAQDWQKASPDPFTEANHGVFFIDANTGWVSGYSGAIYKTTDAGGTWTKQTSGTSQYLEQPFFLSSTNGYICGSSGTILHTTDGGTSWTAQTSNTTRDLHDIHFLTANNGFAVGNDGRYAATTDGGTTWTEYSNGAVEFYAIDFADANVGVMVGVGGVLYRTTNAGSSWSLGNSGHANLTFDVTFTSATDGYLVGSAGTIRKTTDAGVTWNAQTSGIGNNLRSVEFTDANNGHASSVAGDLINTTNGGTNWTTSSSSFSNGIYCLYFTSASTGYGVGDSGLLVKTTDSGVNWTQLSEGLQNACNSISFPSSLIAYFAGMSANVWKSTDGGDNWQKLVTGIDQYADLYGCYFTDTNTGWVAVDDWMNVRGDIFKTTNGGTNWTQQTSLSTFKGLFSVTFYDANYGWACGKEYQVIRTTNGGTDWTSVSPAGSGIDFYGLAAVDQTTAIVAGGNKIYKTTDGGTSWVEKTSFGAGYTSLAMSSPLIGAACDAGGDIFRTTDGGETWSNTPVASAGAYLYYVTFNGSVGLVVGGNGYVGVSTDAGATWAAQTSGTTASLYGAALQGEKALISGESIILKNDIANPMPVELVSFTAHAVSGGITLAWKTATEIDNYGFEIERASLSEGAKNFKTIGFVTGNGSSNSPKEYSFFDASVPAGTNVYRLKQIDNSGTYEYSQEIEADGVIESFELSQNIPNPFNPETEIYYTAAVPSVVRLQVYSVTGELVETLVDKVQEAGAYRVTFGGKDLAGGVYLYTLSASPLNGAAPVTITKKMVLLK